MNPVQLERCAARLPARERLEFLQLHGEAARLLARAWELRRAAWDIYRPFAPRKRP